MQAEATTRRPNALHEKLTGQILELELPTAAEKVSALKKLISQEVDLPPSKQQLAAPGLGFIKDGVTLAQYNIGSGTVLNLTLRERGGKRK